MTNRNFARIALGVAAVLMALDPAPVSAQTTFTACRVPDVGAIYMIGVSGAPTDCLDASHVEFSWTEGGAPGPNSITSDMIVDGTIAAADIATDAVTAAKIAPNAVGSTEILNNSIQAADLSAGAVIEPGVEFMSSNGGANFDPTTTNTTAHSMTLSYPASGYIVAHAIGQIQCSTTSTINLGITNGGTADDGWVYQVQGGSYTMVSKQEVLQVTGSGNATVNFNVQITSTDNCTYFRAIDFDAIYVPVRY